MQTLQSCFLATQERILAFGESNFSRGPGYWTTPADEKKEGFFEKLVDRKSQRENWYRLTKYVAEPACAISNVGFFYVGLKHKNWQLLFAGTASAASHTIPKKWLLLADKIGVLVVLSKFAFEFDAVRRQPWLVLPLVGASAINIADAYLARKKSYTWPHVTWHLTAALLADVFLTATQKTILST